jgi:hypothetical protein
MGQLVVKMMKRGIAPGLIAVTMASPVWANGGHGHTAGDEMAAPLWVWAVGLGVLTVIVLFIILQFRRGARTGQRFMGFSRNARLLLLRSPFSGLSISLLRLLFNLYLLAVGFDTLFVAKFVAINWICHGFTVIPSGVLAAFSSSPLVAIFWPRQPYSSSLILRSSSSWRQSWGFSRAHMPLSARPL